MVSQTLLPMPTGMELIYQAQQNFNFSRGENVDLDIKSAVEGIVIKWASICTDVLKVQSTISFAHGQHPTPYVEVDFWNARLKNLENIYDQLRDPRVKKMMLYLECTSSTYLQSFKTLFKDIVAAVVEARNICLYMKPMIKHFSRFEDIDFLDNEPYIKPLAHSVGLLWANCKYYCINTKIVTLLQMIGNLLIEATIKQLDPSSTFQGEADDVYKKMDKCVRLLELFKSAFEIVRANIMSYFKADEEPKPWLFHPRSVFQRLMNFIDRLKLVLSILETNLEFTRLEKVEIGGLRGRGLSFKCLEVFEEFNVIYNVFRNIQYEVLDPGDMSIVEDNETFKTKCLDLDRRLAAIFSQAYDDCFNLDSIFKLLNVIGKLIERPLINAEITCKFPLILDMFNDELNTVKILFDYYVDEQTPIDSYFPPVSGKILWLHKLKLRIRKVGEDFLLIDHPIVKSEEAEYMLKKREQMLVLLETRYEQIFSAWCAEVPSQITKHLNKFVLIKLPNHLIAHNFHDELVAILRETRYLKMLQIENLPPSIEEFYARMEEYNSTLNSVKRIVENYNHLKLHTLKVEYVLIEAEMLHIDEQLEKLIDEFIWVEESMYLF